MNNPQVTVHLNIGNWWVKAKEIEALGNAGDNSAVPVLIEALKDERWYVRLNAVEALGKLGNICNVFHLIEASKDENHTVHLEATEALDKLGDEETLPRKILAASCFSAQKRISLLEALRRVRCKSRAPSYSLYYTFPDIRSLCQAMLTEENPNGRDGAQIVLDWLNGESELLRGSQPNSIRQARELLRAGQSDPLDLLPSTLLRASHKPEMGVTPSMLRQRLFRKCKKNRR